MVNTNGVTIKVNAACWRELTFCIILFVLSHLLYTYLRIVSTVYTVSCLYRFSCVVHSCGGVVGSVMVVLTRSLLPALF